MKWLPLPKIAYGIAIYPFSPSNVQLNTRPSSSTTTHDDASILSLTSTDQQQQQQQQEDHSHFISLEVGDEVFIIEQQAQWYRGYVLTVQEQGLKPNKAPIGCFPRTHVQIKEYIDLEVEPRRREISTSSSSSSSSSIGLFRSFSESHIPTAQQNSDYQVNSVRPGSFGDLNLDLDPTPELNSHIPPPPLPFARFDQSTITGCSEPLVDEIAACVSEWNSLLYTYINKRKYQTFNNVRDHINYLFQARRQLLDQALSREELIKLRKEIVQRMVTCNMELHQEIIIRHPEKGYLLDTTNTSLSNIYRIHWKYANQSKKSLSSNLELDTSVSTGTINSINNMSHLNTSNAFLNNHMTSSSNNSASQLKGGKFHHLFFELKACIAHICQPGEFTELYFALYSSIERKFITEQFVVVLTFNGMPKDETQIGKLQALFVDLSSHDMSENLYMVCHLVRLGGMKLTENKEYFGPTTQFFLHGNKHSSLQKLPSSTSLQSNMCRRPFGCAVLNLSAFQQEHDTVEYDMPIFIATSESNYYNLYEDIIFDRSKEFVKHPRAEMLRVSLRSFYGYLEQVLKTNAALLQEASHTLRLGFADVAFPNETRNELYIKLDAGDLSQVGRSRNIQVVMCVRDNKTGEIIENAISFGAGAKPVNYWESIVIYHEQRPKWGEMIKIQIQDFKQWERSHVFLTVKHRSSNSMNSGTTASSSTKPSDVVFGGTEKIIAMGFLPLFLPPFHRDFVADGSHTICLYKYDKQYISPRYYLDVLPWCVKSTAPSNISGEIKLVKPHRKFGHQHSPSNQSFKSMNGSLNSSTSAFNMNSSSSELNFSPSAASNSKLASMRDSVTLSTFLCSTKFTQNKTLVKLLNWRALLETSEEGTSELLAVLDQFTFVGEVEVVKFLNDILDALLDIMQDEVELVNREINDQVLAAIIWLLGIVQDRRFSNFRPVLDVYIEQRFSKESSHIHKYLMKSLTRLCENPSEASKAKLLRSSMKVWDYLFRFIVRSRLQSQKQRPDDDTFQHDMDTLLKSITNVMSPEHPNAMIGTQTLALQHFADILVELQKIFTCQQVVTTTISFVDACSHVTGRLVGFKLAMILNIVKGPIFDDATCRPEIAKHVFRWIRLWLNSYMATAKDVIFARQVEQQQQLVSESANPQQTRLPRAQWIENLRLSLTIMSELLDKIRKSIGMTSSGLTSSCISSPSVSTYSRPTSFAAVPEEQEATDCPPSSLTAIIDEALQLVPQLLNAYKDLQRLTIQAIHVSSTPPGAAVIDTTPSSTMNSRPHSRQSFSILRERASSIGNSKSIAPEILQEIQAANANNNNNSNNKSKFTVVLQALSTSPTVPFPSTYPFQTSSSGPALSKDATQHFTSDHVAMVSTGLLDLTVVLLELFYLTPKHQWTLFIKKMYEQDGIEMTAEFLRKIVYTCMGILFGDNVMTLEESSLTVDHMGHGQEEDASRKRRLPPHWLNMNTIAHQIVLCDILDPIKTIFEVPAFMPTEKAYMAPEEDMDHEGEDEEEEDAIDDIVEEDEDEEVEEALQFTANTKTRVIEEQRSALLLWRVYFIGFLRVIGSPRLDVSDFTPQTQRAVWKIIGDMRGDVGAKTALYLWRLAGQSGPAFNQLVNNNKHTSSQSDYFSSESNVDYFADLRKSMASSLDDNTNEFNTISPSTTLSYSVRNSVRIAPTEEAPLSSIHEETYAAMATTEVPFLQVDLAYFVLSPLCAVCLTLHDRVRKNALSIIADIIAIELYSFGELINVQHALISALDRLIMSDNKADEEVASRITHDLGHLLVQRLHNDNRTDLEGVGKRVVESLSTFMNLLLQIRSLPSDDDEYNDERITATLRLMKFIQVIEREEIYIKYVHQLVQLHLESENYIEAALTLRFHSDLLQWDPSDKLAPIPELALPVQTSFSRKESLYMTMLKYLDRGSAWELCIQICKELAYEYENTLYNYAKLGDILQRQASFVEHIAKKERCFTEYFRVGFYGRGFPASNRNTQYIYRGLEWEKMPSFIERMQNRHPNAQLLPSKIANSVSITDEQLKELNSTLDGQYLQITPVTPIPDTEMVPCLSNPYAPDSIKKYYAFNNVSKFSFSRPVTKESRTSDTHKQPESDFLNLWTEKIEFECEDKFPTIVRRSKIIHAHANVISPIENAVAAVENKNKELESLERKYSVYLPKHGNSNNNGRRVSSININPFSMSLNGAVDAPVNGGIPLYKKAFLGKDYWDKNPDMRQWIYRLQAAIEDQVSSTFK